MTASAFLADASINIGIPLAALIVSVAALVYGAMGGRRDGRRAAAGGLEQAMADRITDLTRQVVDLKDEVKECAAQRKTLERENIALLRRIVKLENGHNE